MDTSTRCPKFLNFVTILLVALSGCAVRGYHYSNTNETLSRKAELLLATEHLDTRGCWQLVKRPCACLDQLLTKFSDEQGGGGIRLSREGNQNSDILHILTLGIVPHKIVSSCILRPSDSSPVNAKHRCVSFPSARGYGGQVAYIQDEHSIKDTMKSQGIPDFSIRRSLGVVGQAPLLIAKFIDTLEALDQLPCYDSFEPALDDS